MEIFQHFPIKTCRREIVLYIIANIHKYQTGGPMIQSSIRLTQLHAP